MNTILLIGILFLALALLLLGVLPFSYFLLYVLIFGVILFAIGLIAQWKFK
jgi:hypothetical protein